MRAATLEEALQVGEGVRDLDQGSAHFTAEVFQTRSFGDAADRVPKPCTTETVFALTLFPGALRIRASRRVSMYLP